MAGNIYTADSGVPVGSANPLPILPTGSNIIIRDRTLNFNEVNLSVASAFTFVGANDVGSNVNVLDISKYSGFGLYVNNLLNVAVNISIASTRNSSGARQVLETIVNGESLAAGATKYYSPASYPALKNPALGTTATIATGATAATSGTIQVVFIGGVKA